MQDLVFREWETDQALGVTVKSFSSDRLYV